MATYYVSDRGSDSNNGTSPATPKLTLAAAETLATAAGDTVYCQGGSVFRETLTATRAGTSGNLISFIADISGKVFGDAGGPVRITGSNNDQTITRSYAIDCPYAYRRFRGFTLDSTSSYVCRADGTCTGQVWEDCDVFASSAQAMLFSNSLSSIIVRRCIIWTRYDSSGIYINDFGGGTTNFLIENCVIVGARSAVGVELSGGNAITVRSSLIMGCAYGVQRNNGNAHVVEDSLIRACEIGIATGTATTVTSRANNFDACGTNKQANVTNGTPSDTTYPILFSPFQRLGSGLTTPFIPWAPFPGVASYVNKAGNAAPSEDWTGAPRSQGTDLDWGPVETRARIASNGSGIELFGKGFHDFQVVAPAGKTLSVTCNVTWTDNANIGTKPRLQLYAPDGTSLSTADASGSGSSEPLTVSSANAAAVDQVWTARLYNRTTYTTNNNLSIVGVFDDPTAT